MIYINHRLGYNNFGNNFLGGDIESEIRKDYYLERYVIFAPKRKKIPKVVVTQKSSEVGVECFFCRPAVDDPKNQIQIKNYRGKNSLWDVKVIGNLYPALSLDNLRAYGKQEVVVETPAHGVEIHQLPVEHIVKIFDVYIDRYKALSKIDGIFHVQIFKNEGGKAGASIPHSHSQIIALPIIPPKIQKESVAINSYIAKTENCPHCDILRSEIKGPRAIFEDEHFFVLAPYASESPYGVWLMPKRHVNNIAELKGIEKHSLAKFLKKILFKLNEIDVSYNYFVQNSVKNYNHHMLVKVAPRPNIWAGLELGTGLIINPILPEEAAKFYKN